MRLGYIPHQTSLLFRQQKQDDRHPDQPQYQNLLCEKALDCKVPPNVLLRVLDCEGSYRQGYNTIQPLQRLIL